jgi:prevent-host-death family protein
MYRVAAAERSRSWRRRDHRIPGMHELTMIIDYSTYLGMSQNPESISVSKFKATCLAVLEEVRRSGRSVLITKRGVPIAELVPPTPATRGASWMGSMAGTFEIVGDIVSPAMDPDDWECLRK